MTQAEFNYFYRVDVTCARYVLGGIVDGTNTVRQVETKVFTLVNKFVQDASTPSDRETMLPILKSIGEVTLSSGEVLPSVSISQITIDNSRGSIGFDRRFSDVLERYTIIQQPIDIYFSQSSNATDAPGAWIKVASGIMQSWQTAISGDAPVLTLSITPYDLADRSMNLEVSRDVTGMENAPEASLNKPLPILFNKTQINATGAATYPELLPTRISNDGATTAVYGLTTQMYQVTKANTLPRLFIEKSWDDGESVWATVNTDASPPSYLTPNPAAYYPLKLFEGFAIQIPQFLTCGIFATGVELKARANGYFGRQSSAYLSVFILLVSSVTKVVKQELARGKVSLANYDELNNNPGATFPIRIAFTNPVIIDPGLNSDYDFYLGWEATDTKPDEADLYKHSPAVVTSYNSLRKEVTAASSQNDWAIGTATNLLAFKFIAPTATFENHVNTFTKDGLTYSKLTLAQSTPDTGQINPNFDALKIVVPMEGMYDYTTSEAIYKPPELIELASFSWDGEQWQNQGVVNTASLQVSHYDIVFYDIAGFSGTGPSHRARYVSGILDTKVTYTQFITEVCRGSACRMGIFSDGKIFVYPWGVTTQPVFHIPESDIIPLNWEGRDKATIVNRAVITAEKTFAIKAESVDREGYVISIDYSAENYSAVKNITEQSYSLFGTKNAEEVTFNVFGFNDETASIGLPGYLTGGPSNSQIVNGNDVVYSVDFLAEYYLTRFGLPLTYCSFVVPYHRYKNIKMFDVITFAHTDFPAYYGTDPAQQSGVVTYGASVETVPRANYGYELVRSQTYRGLVEAVSYVLAMEHAPAIRLTVQVLLNRNFDPT
jgi:hypothetical protein